jgi:hypothetical protein
MLIMSYFLKIYFVFIFNRFWLVLHVRGADAQLVAAGGVNALFSGVGLRFARVVVEVSLLFTLYEHFGRAMDQVV